MRQTLTDNFGGLYKSLNCAFPLITDYDITRNLKIKEENYLTNTMSFKIVKHDTEASIRRCFSRWMFTEFSHKNTCVESSF